MNVASIGFSAALVISIAAALVSSRAEAQNQLPKFDLTNPSAAQLATKKVRVAPNVTINVGKFVSESSLRKHESTKIAFTSGFKRNFLKTPPRYAEKVESLGDRLVVTRTLNLDFKDPCAPGIPAGLGVCFRPTRKRIKPSVAAYLKKTRAKLSALDRKGAKSSKHAGLLKMNDAQLLDALLNKNNSKKVITQTSTVPFVSYDFDKVPKNLNLNNRSQRLPRGISLSPSRVRALRGRSSGAGGSSASPAVGTTEQPAPRRSSKMNRSLRFETDSEHTQPLVMGWTLGRRYGHTYEIEFAEETLLTDRYYARFEFTIGFGVGLRMPLEVTVKSKVDKVAVSPRMIADYPATRLCPGAAGDISKAHLCAAQAKIEVSARAIPESESTEDFYKKAGVITSKLFDGSELVMEGGLTCSFRASIPGPDIRTITCPSYLQKEFSYSFDPRLGSGEHKRLFRHFFDGRDAGLGFDLGLGYAVLDPGLTVDAERAELTFDVAPWNSTGAPRKLTLTNASRSFTLRAPTTVGTRRWGVELKNPVYRVNASVRPMMKIRIGVDLGVYEWSHSFGPIGLGSLDLPTISFPAHEGTRPSFRLQSGLRKKL